MSERVLVTAGHVDHGKSTLVQALTGVHPDRLPQEKSRGMTIELGFTPLDLGEHCLHIVDVPGHEDLVRVMVAGAMGAQGALLVVAADQGVGKQTLEHLRILQTLGVKDGVVVLTRSDLADAEMREWALEEVKETLAGFQFHDWPHIMVSAPKGEGIPELKKRMEEMAIRMAQAPKDRRAFRLPIDRHFSLSGIGTVVTGTGQGRRGKAPLALEIWPGGGSAKVRSWQQFGEKTDMVEGGWRLAANLSNRTVHEVPRGSVLCPPGWGGVSRYLLLKGTALPKTTGVQVHLLTEVVEATLRPLESDLTEIRLARPLPFWAGDSLILRQPHPVGTLGGGKVVALLPRRLKIKRSWDALALSLARTPQAGWRIPLLLAGMAGLKKSTLQTLTGFEESEIHHQDKGWALAIGGHWLAPPAVEAWKKYVVRRLDQLVKNQPLQQEWQWRELVGKRLDWFPLSLWNELEAQMVQQEMISHGDKGVTPIGGIDLSPQITALLEAERLKVHTCSPRPLPISKQELTPPQRHRLVQEGGVVVLPGGALLWEAALKEVYSPWLMTQEAVSIRSFKENFELGRSGAIPLLEYFDSLGWTRREGDQRVVLLGRDSQQ